MNARLVDFVRQVRKPNGQPYRPDVLLYFVYGLQLDLTDAKREEKLLMDPSLTGFQAELDTRLEPHHEALVTAINEERGASFASCLREAHLWECQQLGVHTPFALVFTMLYFNTKYFRLYTVEQHEQLSFARIHRVNRRAVAVASSNQGSSQNSTPLVKRHKVSCLQLVPLALRDPPSSPQVRIKKPLDQPQNLDRPTECPIKHYTFYLSKCPESVRTRSDVFYLVPETTSTPESPVWFSTQPVPRDLLARMLRRVLLVEDVLQNLCV